MDNLFKEMLFNDKKFKSEWRKTPFIYCEEVGSSHTLSHYNFGIYNNNIFLKNIFKEKPLYVLKLSGNFEKSFINSKRFKNSNINFALKMSKRRYIYKHKFKKIFSTKLGYKKSILKRIINKFKNIFFKFLEMLK